MNSRSLIAVLFDNIAESCVILQNVAMISLATINFAIMKDGLLLWDWELFPIKKFNLDC